MKGEKPKKLTINKPGESEPGEVNRTNVSIISGKI